MAAHKVVCWDCGAEVDDPFVNTCPRCGGLLTVKMDLEQVKEMKPEDLHKEPIGVWRYAPFMPVDPAHKVSIQEGGTPLYPTRALGAEIGVENTFVKFEGLNPTGSFKDRGMTIGVSHAKELGAKVVGCASTGNTSAALAAYAAKAGMKCAVFLPSGKVAMGKLAQALFFGAKVLSIDGNFDDALALARKMADERKLYLLNSINPYRPEGQKSVLFEIMDQLRYNVPDRIILPVGNAANIWAVYKAVTELQEVGWIDKVPMLTGIQAEGASPVARAFRQHSDDFIPEENPETVATAIRIGNPVSGRKAPVRAARKERTRVTRPPQEPVCTEYIHPRSFAEEEASRYRETEVMEPSSLLKRYVSEARLLPGPECWTEASPSETVILA